MYHRKIPVACVQLRAHDRKDFDACWPHAVELVDAAGARGAKLVVLPEGTVPGYVLGHVAVAEAQLERARADLSAAAQRHEMTIVYGAAKIVRGQTFNAAIVIGPGGEALGYSAKQFLWHFDRRWFAPGRTLEPIDTPVGRLGVLVCADGRIPTIAATLVERGAEMLVMPTAWVTSGRDPGVLENVQADLMINVRARENGVPFVAANKAGVELASVAYCGKSALVDATGAFIARGSETREEIVIGDVSVGAPGRTHTSHAIDVSVPSHDAKKARIAFTPAWEPAELAALAKLAAVADADVLVACGTALATPVPLLDATSAAGTLVTSGPIRAAIVHSEAFEDPRGLVAARMGGVDFFIWQTGEAGDPDWHIRFARTRAAELRAFAIVIDRLRGRAFSVDPDGIVTAGTFGAYRMASFVYDPARAAATLVAPATDVAQGLRVAEAIRSGASAVAAAPR